MNIYKTAKKFFKFLYIIVLILIIFLMRTLSLRLRIFNLKRGVTSAKISSYYIINICKVQ